MKIVLDGREVLKGDCHIGDMVRMNSGFYTLVKLYLEGGSKYTFMDTFGGCGTGVHYSIRELMVESEGSILEHYPHSEWELKLQRKK